ncbi:MAG: SAM-dependent methyltransferase, partial [Candidatus Thermoplasmatota archaeon]|nr:SAM-dependent methyltransferase [Candidatus Thermoplasmatota archaeon]
LVIAHSDSRDSINKVHMDADQAVSGDKLPPISQLGEMMCSKGLKPLLQRDDREYYIMVAEK